MVASVWLAFIYSKVDPEKTQRNYLKKAPPVHGTRGPGARFRLSDFERRSSNRSAALGAPPDSRSVATGRRWPSQPTSLRREDAVSQIKTRSLPKTPNPGPAQVFSVVLDCGSLLERCSCQELKWCGFGRWHSSLQQSWKLRRLLKGFFPFGEPYLRPPCWKGGRAPRLVCFGWCQGENHPLTDPLF